MTPSTHSTGPKIQGHRTSPWLLALGALAILAGAVASFALYDSASGPKTTMVAPRETAVAPSTGVRAEARAKARALAPGAHLCVGGHYNPMTLLCRSDDHTITAAQYGTAEFDVVAPPGGFPAETVDIAIQLSGAGTVPLGSSAFDHIDRPIFSMQFSYLIPALGLVGNGEALRNGASYTLTATSDGAEVGRCTFTYKDS